MPDLNGVDPVLAGRIAQLQQLCPSTGIASGRRSTAQQAELRRRWEAGELDVPAVAKAGTSHHETGTAVDVSGDRACIERHLPGLGLAQTVRDEWWHLELAGANQPNSATSTEPPRDPLANAEALFMSTIARDVGDPVEPDPVHAAISGQTTTTQTTQPGGDWQATLTPAERWILEKESGLDPTADNPTSTAFGLWQGLEATRKQYLGDQWQTTDPNLQLDAFRRYVKDRYGTPENAKAFHEEHGYY